MPSDLYYAEFINIGVAVTITASILVWAWRSYGNHRYVHELAIVLMLCFFVAGEVFQGSSNVFDLPTLTVLGFSCFFMAFVFTAFWVDTVSRTSVDPIKLAIVAVLGTLLAVTALAPNSVATTFQWTPVDPYETATQGPFRTCISIIGLFQGLLVLVYFCRIFLRCPPKLKRPAVLLLSGAIVAGVVTPFTYVLGLTLIVPGIFYIFVSIGSALIILAFVKVPSLAFVLPFRAYRIDVVNRMGGLNIFSYAWDPDPRLTNPFLYSGAYHGISNLIKEMTQKGSIKHIQMEQGVLIVAVPATVPLLCVLLCSKISPVLTRALDTFAGKLEQGINPEDLTAIIDQERLPDIKAMLDEAFPFVPDYT